MIKLGILGCGMIGLSFVKQAIRHKDFKIVALCSKTLNSLEKAHKYVPYAQKYFNKIDFFKDSTLDAVIVCTPHSQHVKDAILSIENGKHVMIEKPIATNLRELEKLATKISENPDIIITALPHGNFEFINFIRDIINSNVIGKITTIHSYLDVPGPPRSNWYYSDYAIGGSILDTFVYAFSRVLNLVEVNIKYAIGLKNQLIPYRKCIDGGKVNSKVDDNTTVVLLLETGQQVIIRSSWNIHQPEDFLEIYGRRGKIKVDVWKNTIELSTNYNETNGFIDNIKMVKKRNNVFFKKLPIINPESKKLTTFAKHIKNKRDNFLEVRYFMDIVLKLLEDNGAIELPKAFYKKIKKITNLSIHREYI